MAGTPLTPAMASQLQSQLAAAHAPANPATPVDRINATAKRLEQYQIVKTVLTHLADDGLETDPTFLAIVASFKLAINAMLLNAEPQYVLSELTRHLATAGSPGMAGMGAPAPQLGMPPQAAGPQPPMPGMGAPAPGPDMSGGGNPPPAPPMQ